MTNDSTSEKFPSVVSSAATPDSGRMEVAVLERGGEGSVGGCLIVALHDKGRGNIIISCRFPINFGLSAHRVEWRCWSRR